MLPSQNEHHARFHFQILMNALTTMEAVLTFVKMFRDLFTVNVLSDGSCKKTRKIVSVSFMYETFPAERKEIQNKLDLT